MPPSDPADVAALRPPQWEGLPDEALEELNRLWTITRAFFTTAHDVNNALQVIAGSAELIEARELDPAVRRRIEIMRHESGKAAAVINRLLEFARAGRQPVERVDLWSVIETAVSMRLASVARSRIALVASRAGAPAAWISAERARLLQLVLNLLLVAEDRVAGQTKARIDVSVDQAGGVTLRIVSTSEGAAFSAAEPGDAPLASPTLAKDAQLWAAGYLAAAHGGVLTIDGGTFSVSWPAS